MHALSEEESRRPVLTNADMVGHTGVVKATITAVETVDGCVGRVLEIVHGACGAGLITADHGNAEHMREGDGRPNTAHSLSRVPLIVTAHGVDLTVTGSLADVAPTILTLLGMSAPSAMTGRSLIRDVADRPHGGLHFVSGAP